MGPGEAGASDDRWHQDLLVTEQAVSAEGWAWRSHGKPRLGALGAGGSVCPAPHGGPGTTCNPGLRADRTAWPGRLPLLAARGRVGSGPGVLKLLGPVAKLPGESVYEQLVIIAHLLSVRGWAGYRQFGGHRPGPVRPLGSHQESWVQWWLQRDTPQSERRTCARGCAWKWGLCRCGQLRVKMGPPGFVRACTEDCPCQRTRQSARHGGGGGHGADVGVLRPHPGAPRTLATPAAGPLAGHAPAAPGLRPPTSGQGSLKHRNFDGTKKAPWTGCGRVEYQGLRVRGCWRPGRPGRTP